MKLAFVYAGQGSQKVGMGEDLYDARAEFRNVMDNLPERLKKLSFTGPMEELTQTENTQPCLVAFACGVTAILRAEGIVPEMAAGLSLGEYSALECAGAMDAKAAVELVSFRGSVMAKAVEGVPCAMSAVLGMDREKLDECCRRANDLGVVQIANYNCPGQLVIGGDKDAVEKASALALEGGAKRVIPLEVSGAFHTPLMKPAELDMARHLENVSFNSLNFPVIFNCTANPLREGESIAKNLEKQICSGVYFEDSIRYMEAAGIDTVIEIGPGRALSGFIKKTTKAIKCYNIEDVASLEATLTELKGAEVNV